MTFLPAPLLRGLALVAIGGALAIGHVAFASAAPTKPVQVATALQASKVDVSTTGALSSEGVLAENCYVELVQEKTVRGKIVTRPVHECD